MPNLENLTLLRYLLLPSFLLRSLNLTEGEIFDPHRKSIRHRGFVLL